MITTKKNPNISSLLFTVILLFAVLTTGCRENTDTTIREVVVDIQDFSGEHLVGLKDRESIGMESMVISGYFYNPDTEVYFDFGFTTTIYHLPNPVSYVRIIAQHEDATQPTDVSDHFSLLPPGLFNGLQVDLGSPGAHPVRKFSYYPCFHAALDRDLAPGWYQFRIIAVMQDGMEIISEAKSINLTKSN